MARRASQPTSQIERHVRRIAADLAKGRAPTPTAEYDEYRAQCPDDVFAALDAFVAHAAHKGTGDPRAEAHAVLIEGLLEFIRYRSDRGYKDAIALIGQFQSRIVELIAERRIDPTARGMLAAALHRAGIPASGALRAAMAEAAPDEPPGEIPPEIGAILKGLEDLCDGDPFQLVALLAETGSAMPTEIRAAMAAAMAASGTDTVRAAAALSLLDPESQVRNMAASALRSNGAAISPESLRRMIAIRNWRPERERPAIDDTVRAARAGGAECAQWLAGSAEEIFASAVDGSGTQGFLIVSTAGKRKRLSSILCKDGIRDAWSGAPEAPRKVRSLLDNMAQEASAIPVSQTYLDRTICHHLHAGLTHESVPPAGLLQVAETLGGAPWQPEPWDWRAALASALADVPPALRTPDATSGILRRSAEWGDLATAESWFEDDQGVADLIGRTSRSARPERMAEYVLETLLAQRRDKWAEHFVKVALWLREAPQPAPWQNFVITAHELANGRQPSDIPLMRDIAAKTILNWAADGDHFA